MGTPRCVACRLQHHAGMSVKTILPILGVGSAFAILGLAAARRQAHHLHADGASSPDRHRSGVHPHVALDDIDDAELEAMAPALTSDFWDAAPDSYSLLETHSRPANEHDDSYDALDTEDLTAEWLTRATEAPAGFDQALLDADDPAEIPADSIAMTMVSEASRHAAAHDPEELDEADEPAADSRV